tara:strand:- start:280 stop:1104 length:825 start_codon:yes stop_codon:yes gene_type:complete
MVTGENNKTLIKDSTFDSLQISNYHLSIELSEKSISYCIVDKNKYRCYLLFSQNYESQNLLKILNEDEFITREFLSKSISFVNFPNTLIPKELYNEKDKKNIFSVNHSLTNEELVIDELKSKIINLYAIPNTIFQTVKNVIPEAIIRSNSSILINNFLSLNNLQETMFLFLKDSYINIVVTKGDGLIFQNKFEYQTKEDLLFYVLFSIQQLNFSNEEINTVIYGNISKEEYNILYQYIRNIKFGNKLKDISCSNEFNNIEDHCYNILYRQFLCV